MNLYIKNIIITFCLYGFLIGLGTWLDSTSPGGPCSPGLGILFMMFIIPIITIFLFSISLIMFINKRKHYLFSLLVSSILIIIGLSQII